MKNSRNNVMAIGRRRFLRGSIGGASAIVGLPLLETMLDSNGTAYADGSEIPTVFGVWFFGNGCVPDEWGVDGSGSNWQPRRALNPIGQGWERQYLSVLSGLTVPEYSKSDRFRGDSKHAYNHGHHSAAATVLSGDQFERRINEVPRAGTISSHFRHPSIDQIAVQRLAQQGLLEDFPFRSLQISAVGRAPSPEGPTFNEISQNGGGAMNPGIYNPAKLFERMFGTQPTAMAFESSRASVLDSVKDDFAQMKKKLGRGDTQRVEQHLQSIRSIEKRIGTEGLSCTPPPKPAEHPDLARHDDIAPKNRVFAELLATALACGMTRVFTYIFTRVGNPLHHRGIGLSKHAHHTTTHSGAGWEGPIGNATVFTMEQLQVFMEVMRGTPMGAGNVLDHLSMLVATEHADGSTHDAVNTPVPLMLVGKGGGRIRGNIAWNNGSNGQYVTRAGLTALRGAGIDVQSWGHHEAKTSSPVPGVLT